MEPMPKAWLSENNSPGSTTAVLLGPVAELELSAQCAKHPTGVLWIVEAGEGELPSPCPKNLQRIIITSAVDNFPEETLRIFLGLNYDAMPDVRVSAAINPESPTYGKVLNFVVTQADATLRARRTRSENGSLRQRNVFRNLAGYLMGRTPESWSGMAEGSLVVVVGAGPSLDVTLPLVREGLGDPVVIAADSALQALETHEITPDLVVNIDPEKSLATCGSPGHCPGIAVLSTQSHPSWKAAWGKNVRYLSGRVLTEDWLARKNTPKTTVQAENNAGLTALLLADYLGADAVLLVGMDLSGSGDGSVRYAKSTRRDHIEIATSHYHKVPGNHEETVSTPFLSDWRETSDNCATIAKRRYLINLNDRGAQLEGTMVIHPDKFDELRETLAGELRPFDRKSEHFEQRLAAPDGELDQLTALLATRCDEIWKRLRPMLAKGRTSSTEEKLRFFLELLGKEEHATLIGDYAFAIMPRMMPGNKPSDAQLDLWLQELRGILWLLEDALIEAEPSEQFLTRFLTQNFA